VDSEEVGKCVYCKDLETQLKLITVVFLIVRPSRVTGPLDVAEIGRLSRVTRRLAAVAAWFITSGALRGAQAPRAMAEFFVAVTRSDYPC